MRQPFCQLQEEVMRRIAKFQKVSWEQFLEGWKDAFPNMEEEKIRKIYDGIRLPRRATAGSAGYDFFSPVDFELKPGETLKMPTGIRAWMEPDWVLKIYPRSGLGFKYRLQLNNTVGIIDSDYYNSDNEGHIFIKITNDSKEGKRYRSRRIPDLPRGFFWNTGLQWMMTPRLSATAAWAALQENRNKFLHIILACVKMF